MSKKTTDPSAESGVPVSVPSDEAAPINEFPVAVPGGSLDADEVSESGQKATTPKKES